MNTGITQKIWNSLSFRTKHLFTRSAAARFIRKKIFPNKLILIDGIGNYDSNILTTLQPSSSITTYGPKTIDSASIEKTIDIPALNLYQFNNVLINVRSSCFVYNNRLLKESYHPSERFNEGFIEHHNDLQASIKNNPVKRIGSAFFLAGNGTWNWYHWITEILPKALFLGKVPVKNIIVSNDLLRFESMLETLKIIAGNNINIIYGDHTKNYLVEKLFHINAISYVPFNMLNNTSLKIEDVFMRKEVLLQLRQELSGHIVAGEQTGGFPEKLFIYRTSYRIARNQDLFFRYLQQSGFERIDFDGLSFTKQQLCMQHAKVVIGITGAAFTNMLFANNQCKFICIMPEALKEFSCFSNLAAICGIELYHDFYETPVSDHSTNEFQIDIPRLMKTYQMLTHE